ncbi:MAG: HEPN domain-containing protein [Nitrososphaeria archaeon]
MSLPNEWIEKAEVFIKDAERHLNDKEFWLSCFEAQQAAEFYLKALILSKTGVYPFTHDLAELLDAIAEIGVNVPSEMYVYADSLTAHYTISRCPGKKFINYNYGLAKRCIEYARKIIEWVKESVKLSS